MTPGDLAVVIPTLGRWPILRRTLGALRAQTVSGFEVVVVVDGDREVPADLQVGRLERQPHRGPGAARNVGVAATRRPLVLFLGDDMIPTRGLVEAHLAGHRSAADPRAGVLGHVDWHPEATGGRLLSWLDWSGTQFDYHRLRGADGRDVGFGRFYSCNVSLTRELFERAGGFDEDFSYYYEDLDLGWRLYQEGFVLRYRSDALVHHLHHYDWDALRRRFEGVAVGERRMAAKHGWFEPYFRRRVLRALEAPRPSRLWPLLADHVPASLRSVRRWVRRRADRWYHHRLSGPFLAAWEAAAERDDGETAEELP